MALPSLFANDLWADDCYDHGNSDCELCAAQEAIWHAESEALRAALVAAHNA